MNHRPGNHLALGLAPLLFLAACRGPGSGDSGPALPAARDIHTFAEPERVRVTHVSLDLELDFERRRASGSARLDLSRRDPAAALVLDTKGLRIERVTGSSGGEREHELGPGDPKVGAPLRIVLAPDDSSVTVHYATDPAAEAMQWLDPAQTAGGRHPFLFTQGQSILTRSWIPLQDSPGVRVTYDARIRVPEGLTPVMSAEQLGPGSGGAFRFRMDRPIPSYLIALACGELAFEPISERCGVWAEPSVVGAARDELVDTEAMMQSAEELFGPYRWARYDVLILPPSFPFGGMENPRLTFATPTILAGDRSLVALVAHELAHSWSGNLVTNATWSDFWLNEGFTVYLEQRIMEQVFGGERSGMEKQLGLADLELEMETLEPWQERLHPDLAGRHPDEAFSYVPYEKGALFLRRIEELVGREAFTAFLNDWFDEHAFQSLTTGDFLAFLTARLPGIEERIDVEEWVHGTGLPDDLPRPRSSLLDRVDRELERLSAGASPAELETAGWVTGQWLHFLAGLSEGLSPEKMRALDEAFGFGATGNSEILCQWLVLSVRHGYGAVDERLESFLKTVGRRKFLKPIYTELAKTPAGLERARAIYAVARPRYHSVSTGTIDQILGWES